MFPSSDTPRLILGLFLTLAPLRWHGRSGVSRSAVLKTTDRGQQNRRRVRGQCSTVKHVAGASFNVKADASMFLTWAQHVQVI